MTAATLQQQVAANRIRSTVLLAASQLVLFAIALLLTVPFGVPAGPVFLATAALLGLCCLLAAQSTMGGRPVVEGDAPALHAAVSRLAATAGIAKPRLVLIDSPDLNAFALGLSPRRATIGVTSGLLSTCTPAEVEGVLAHEISHLTNNDTRVAVVAMAVTSILMGAAIGGLALAAGGAAATQDDGEDADSTAGLGRV